MYVGLIVRDECERSVKTQVSKNEQLDFTIVSQEAYTRKEPHVKHMTRRWKVMPSCIFRKCLTSKANP